MTRRLRVAATSPDIRIGDREGNLRRIEQAIAEAIGTGASLVVLPELATSGYVFESRREAESAALTADDERWPPLRAALPPGAVAVVGYCERAATALFNSAAVLTRSGTIGTYRKSHLWGEEATFFAPGDRAGDIFATPVGKLAVAICYDNEFPEVPRRLALAGADILALPVNWPLVDRPAGEHPPETIQAMAASRSSRLATVIADRHGAERGIAWTDGTAVIGDDGWIAALPTDGVAAATLTLHDHGDKALPPHNDLFADRRPELY